MDVPKLVGEEETPGGRKSLSDIQTGFTTLFLPGFQTKLSPCKSRYDLVFNGGGEISGCVKTPPIKRLRLNKV